MAMTAQRVSEAMRQAYLPIQIEAGSIKNITDSTMPLHDVLKTEWDNQNVLARNELQRQFYGTLQNSVRFKRPKRSDRTKRTGLSYRQRQARGRAVRRVR